MTADQMPDELYVFTSQQGERITYHASTDSDTCGTLYTRQHPSPAQAQGERGKAFEIVDKFIARWANDDQKAAYSTIKAALSHAPEVVTEEQFIEKTGYVDIYDKIIASGFIITRKD